HDSFNRVLGFEPGGRRLLVGRSHTPSHTELLIVDPADGTATSLTDGEPSGRYVAVRWAPEGGHLYCLNDCDGDFMVPVAIDAGTGKRTLLETGGCDYEDASLAPNGQRLVYSANRDGYSVVYIRDLANGTRIELA